MENDISKQVLEMIGQGKVSMRSRFYYLLQLIIVSVLSVVTLSLSIFAISFVMFSIHESGELLLLGFGEKGLRALTALFPWLTLLLAFGAILLLEWLLRYFKFGYRISMLRIFLTLTAIAITGSILINLTPLHARLLERADHDTLPVIGAIYEEIHDSHQQQGVFRGYVASTSAGSFTITHNDNDRDTDDGSWTIIPPVGFDIVSLSVGDRVYVAGKLQRDLVYAYGVKISQDRE